MIASAAQSDGIALIDDRPLVERLAAQRAANERMIDALLWVQRELDETRREPHELRESLRRDATPSPEERDDQLAALAAALAGRRVQTLGYL